MKALIRAAIAVVVFLPCCAIAQNTLPTVQVTATTSDGWSVSCRGQACQGIMVANSGGTIKYNQPPMEGSGGGVVNVTKFEFCQIVKTQQPANCNTASPPPSPLLPVTGRPAWQPNGCGVGGWSNTLASAVAGYVAGANYSGNLDAPSSSGVSFLNACNQHDRCYAMQAGKVSCDATFSASMLTACNGDAVCTGWANLYAGVVQTSNTATDAYNSNFADRNCAQFAADMRANGCF